MDLTASFSQFNSGLQIEINNGTINAQFNPPTDPLDKLPVAYGAEFDSYMDQHEDECLPGTRIELLNEITDWAVSPQGKCIFWLNGMAGTGKSTISRTVAKSFKKKKILGASFFFKRGEGDRGNATKLFPTLIRQLARNIPQLVPSVQKALHNNADIGTKGLKEQFDTILLQPLLDLVSSTLPVSNAVASVVLVIDALDECDVENDIRLLLQLLPQLQCSKAICLRVILTSRPELPIRLGFKKLAKDEFQDLILHEIPEEVIERDLSVFFNHRISKIREEREPPLPFDWPGATNIQKLVTLSIPLFIFAATICRVFEDPDWDPMDSLPEILAHQNDESKLDSTYLPVLSRLLNRQTEKQKVVLIKEFHQVVGTIVILQSPLSVESLARLLSVPERLIYLRLNSLHSVIKVPSEESSPIQLFHLSFRDFLLDLETRAKTPLWVDESEMHRRLTISCLCVCQSLRRNICQLKSEGTRRSEIDEQTIDQYLPPELQYACRYWAFHLVQCKDSSDSIPLVLSFLEEHFLHWFEAMCLLGRASEVIGIINLLQNAIPKPKPSPISEFLQDAKRFILRTRQIADEAPLQIYSGLVFAPRRSIVRKRFQRKLPSFLCLLPNADEIWGLELQTVENHSSVTSLAFSSDGRLLASGCFDEAVRIWDTSTGALQLMLKGHCGVVNSVAFSPDNRLLASGSEDKTVRLWDMAAPGGVQKQTLQGHSGPVRSVMFSPDNQILASGADDSLIKLWNITTGTLKQTLKGPGGRIYSISFSPNGQLLASGSHGNSVCLWDLDTYTVQQTLDHGQVQSVAFSPDGRLLVSSSHNGPAQLTLWDIATGTPFHNIKVDRKWFSSIAISPNGQLLASACDENSIWLWDIGTGTLQQILKGHSHYVPSVVFSPDGQLLASGSSDQTVRLWDMASAVPQIEEAPKGHLDAVTSIALSSDGRLVASGSADMTVRLWDTSTGATQQILKGHSRTVDVVMFSTDGLMLASGSDDQTVRLWDTAAGDLRYSLEGHSGPINSMKFSPNDRLLASFSTDETVRLWDTATGTLRHTLKDHPGFICQMKFSPNSQLLVTGSPHSGGKKAWLWDMATGALRQSLETSSGVIDAVIFSPDSQLLASGCKDKTVRLWDTATGALKDTLKTDRVITDILTQDEALSILTKLGFIDSDSRVDIHAYHSPKVGISQRADWIVRNGEEVLWLPPEARPSPSSSIQGNMVALGHSSGQVFFMGFRA